MLRELALSFGFEQLIGEEHCERDGDEEPEKSCASFEYSGDCSRLEQLPPKLYEEDEKLSCGLLSTADCWSEYGE